VNRLFSANASVPLSTLPPFNYPLSVRQKHLVLDEWVLDEENCKFNLYSCIKLQKQHTSLPIGARVLAKLDATGRRINCHLIEHRMKGRPSGKTLNI